MRTKILATAAILLIILAATAYAVRQTKGTDESNNTEQAQKVASGQPDEQGKTPSENGSGNLGNGSGNQGAGSKNSNSSTKPSPSPSLPPNTMPLKVELTPTCGSHGTLMTLKIETRKTASLSLAVAYSDYRGPYWVGHADDQGRFTYTWVIEPEAAMGDGMVFVGVGDSSPGPDEYSAYSTGESAREIVRFRVATRC